MANEEPTPWAPSTFIWTQPPVPFRCPVCDGRGVLAYPPGTPAGQAFVSTSMGPWPCRSCAGTGIIWSNG